MLLALFPLLLTSLPSASHGQVNRREALEGTGVSDGEYSAPEIPPPRLPPGSLQPSPRAADDLSTRAMPPHQQPPRAADSDSSSALMPTQEPVGATRLDGTSNPQSSPTGGDAATASPTGFFRPTDRTFNDPFDDDSRWAAEPTDFFGRPGERDSDSFTTQNGPTRNALEGTLVPGSALSAPEYGSPIGTSSQVPIPAGRLVFGTSGLLSATTNRDNRAGSRSEARLNVRQSVAYRLVRLWALEVGADLTGTLTASGNNNDVNPSLRASLAGPNLGNAPLRFRADYGFAWTTDTDDSLGTTVTTQNHRLGTSGVLQPNDRLQFDLGVGVAYRQTDSPAAVDLLTVSTTTGARLRLSERLRATASLGASRSEPDPFGDSAPTPPDRPATPGDTSFRGTIGAEVDFSSLLSARVSAGVNVSVPDQADELSTGEDDREVQVRPLAQASLRWQARPRTTVTAQLGTSQGLATSGQRQGTYQASLRLNQALRPNLSAGLGTFLNISEFSEPDARTTAAFGPQANLEYRLLDNLSLGGTLSYRTSLSTAEDSRFEAIDLAGGLRFQF